MRTGFNYENDEDAKIIIVLKENERGEKKRWQAWLWNLKAEHATFPPEFQKQAPVLGLSSNHSSRKEEILNPYTWITPIAKTLIIKTSNTRENWSYSRKSSHLMQWFSRREN